MERILAVEIHGLEIHVLIHSSKIKYWKQLSDTKGVYNTVSWQKHQQCCSWFICLSECIFICKTWIRMTTANFRLTVALGERKVEELGGVLSLSLKVSLILKTEICNFIDFQNVL